MRWDRFEEAVYAYVNEKFLAHSQQRDLGQNDSPYLVYALYLALKERNKFFVDIVFDGQGQESLLLSQQSRQNSDSVQQVTTDSREVILRPALTKVPELPFCLVSKKMFAGNALKLGINVYFEALIENLKQQLNGTLPVVEQKLIVQ